MVIGDGTAQTYDTCQAVLEQLSTLLQTGDLLVVEVGVLDELGLSDTYQDGPNHALSEWFAAHLNVFTVDRTLCDMFGRNATYAPNTWLCKN